MSTADKNKSNSTVHIPAKKIKLTSPSPESEKKVEGPNILVTGTPGVGKSRLCRGLIEKDPKGIQWINVGQFAKDRGMLGEYDEVFQCHELDEDKIIDELEETMQRLPKAGTVSSETGQKRTHKTVLIDHQVIDFFPERWFDIVFVLRTDNTILYDRLGKHGRGYSDKKLQDNIECEIFQTVLDEAKECYPSEIVHELPSNSETDLEQNIDRVISWISQWISDNS